jgi:hypothetical protein
MTFAWWRPGLALGILAGSLFVADRSDASVVTRERVEISAPILPDVLILYQPFPTTLDGEKAMAHAAALTFERLLPECAPDYPAITLPPATSAELAANYNARRLRVRRAHRQAILARPAHRRRRHLWDGARRRLAPHHRGRRRLAH